MAAWLNAGTAFADDMPPLQFRYFRSARRSRTNGEHRANINALQAMVFTDGPKMLLTPTYFVYKLCCPFQDASLVPVQFDAGTYSYSDITLPRLDVIAAKAKDGRIYLALSNLDPHRTPSVNLSVMGFKASAAAGETLVAPTWTASTHSTTHELCHCSPSRPLRKTVR